MKLAAIFIQGLLLLNPASVAVEKWVIEKNSSLTIEGKTNINTFKCDIVQYLNQDTILLYNENIKEHKPVTAKGALTLNIKHFDCHHKYITADLKKTLKADENAYMKINLLSFGYIKPNTSNQNITGYAEINLAGVTKKIKIDYFVVKNQPGFLHLTGSKNLLFSDFKLSPPKKLAGLIKVEQEIKVIFQLVLRSVSNKSAKH